MSGKRKRDTEEIETWVVLQALSGVRTLSKLSAAPAYQENGRLKVEIDWL